MACRRFAAFAAGLGLLLAAGRCPAGQPSQGQESVDWPATISALRQEMQRRPGLAYIRRQLATAYNNYGVSLAGQGQWESAKQQLEQALALVPDDAGFKQNLASVYLNEAHTYYTSRQSPEAKFSVEQAITLSPSLAQAYILLGDIEYDNQRLKQAKTAWESAMRIDPTLEHVSERLEQVTKELPVESEFAKLSQAYFDLHYEEVFDAPIGFDIRSMLIEARREVGSDFAYWPSHKIVVLVYSPESFRKLRETRPEWVAGEYDGKMRVRLPSGQHDLASVKDVLFHEYTHAILYDLTQGRCPRWLDEGLATYEGKRYGSQEFDQLAVAFANHQLVPLSQLDQQFSFNLPQRAVALGYQEAYSLVRYLIERYGFWRVRRILKALGSGAAMDEVIGQELHLKPVRLEQAWQEWIPQSLRNGS